MDQLEKYNDATAMAAQLGRLDLVSLLLAAIGLILIAGGVFAFLNLRGLAKAVATQESRETAEKIAERAVNEYLQKELPDLIEAYRSFLDSEEVSGDSADAMAGAQDDPVEAKK